MREATRHSLVVVTVVALSCVAACKRQSADEARPSVDPSRPAAATAPPRASAPEAAPAAAPSGEPASDVLATSDGSVRFVPVQHGTLRLELGTHVIYVDPYQAEKLPDAPKADLVLVTDIHPDHYDPKALEKVQKDGTKIIAPKVVADKEPRAQVLANGQRTNAVGIEIEAVPMYNLKRGPKPGALFHDKGRGNGYLLTVGDKRIYVAGDTECTDEMRALKNVDVAFVPMNLPYTMPPEEAAECVKAFRPKVVYPYHYRGSDLGVFKAALADVPAVEVRVRDWYGPS